MVQARAVNLVGSSWGFMTMYARQEENKTTHLSGVIGDILAPERLTARSLAQFYLKHNLEKKLIFL